MKIGVEQALLVDDSRDARQEDALEIALQDRRQPVEPDGIDEHQRVGGAQSRDIGRHLRRVALGIRYSRQTAPG